MARLLFTLLTGLVIVGAFWLMWRSWQRRSARTSGLPALAGPPAGADAGLQIGHATYLGTVTSEHWMDRVASHDLGGRGPSAVAVSLSGIRFDRVGQATPVYIGSDLMEGVSLQPGLAGRTFGKDSVVVLSWRLGEQTVHTGIRVPDQALRTELFTELRRLCANANSTTDSAGAQN